MDVLNEVEDLFKKLETVPADIKKAALNRIFEKLSYADKKRSTELSSRKRLSRRRKKEKESEQRGEFIKDFTVENVLTSRGRKAQRICYAQMKPQNAPEEQKTDPCARDNVLTSVMREQISLDDTYSTLNEDLVIDEKSGQNDDNISELVSENGEVVQEKNFRASISEDDIKLEPSSEESQLVIADPPFINLDLIEPRAFSSNEEMDQHFSRFRRNKGKTRGKGEPIPLSCCLCPFQTRSRIKYRSHQRKHGGQPPFICYICGKAYCHSSSLRVHLKRHRGQRDFPCDYGCSYRAYTKGDKIRHMTQHTGERCHQCHYCGKQFSKDSNLHEHLRSIHERPNKHICPTCGFSTYRANNLRVHISMRHRGEYNHVCPVCGMKVKQRAPFLDHVRSHTGERPYKCPLCESSFACVARLTVHRKSVHGPREFNCKQCKKCFQTKHHLERHELIHTNKKPYDCPYCSYSCNTQGNVTKHVKSVHNKPDFSYRKYKTDQLADSDWKVLESEWVEKGEKVTSEYLKDLSKKVGREVTLSELKELEAKKKKCLTDNVEQVKKRRSRKREHDYHSIVNPEVEDQLEEEAVDEPAPLLLDMAQTPPNSTTNNVMGGTASSLLQTQVLHDVPNNQSSNTQPALFLQHDPEIGSLQPVLSDKTKKKNDLDTSVMSGQNIEFCMNEQIPLEGQIPLHVIYHSSCSPSANNTSQGNAAPDSNDTKRLNNFNFVEVNNDISSNKTVVVIINTDNC